MSSVTTEATEVDRDTVVTETRDIADSVYVYVYVYVSGMQVLQYLRYCNTSGSLTPLPCRVVNHCLVV